MPSHIQITFTDIQPEQQEWTLAHLAEAGYEGFEEKENELVAYVAQPDYDPVFLKELAFKYQLHYREQIIPEQNWNQVWESNFAPVVIDDFVSIRADFHPAVPGVQFEILITPKMSFGTGHHATTAMMIRQMREMDLLGKTVFDFGTGTGILAILAEKLGASEVVAADHDDWSIENAKENILKNNCHRIQLKKIETLNNEHGFDVILANINRHVIVDQFTSMVEHLNKNGTMVLSGILQEDEKEIMGLAGEKSLYPGRKMTTDNWLSIRFSC